MSLRFPGQWSSTCSDSCTPCRTSSEYIIVIWWKLQVPCMVTTCRQASSFYTKHWLCYYYIIIPIFFDQPKLSWSPVWTCVNIARPPLYYSHALLVYQCMQGGEAINHYNHYLGLVDLHIVLYILPQVEHTGPRLAALVHLQGHKTCECAEGEGGYQYMYVYVYRPLGHCW